MADLFRIDSNTTTPWGFVTTTVKEMPNGEVRYRMKMPDGSAAHYTIAGDKEPEWQAAHFHKGLDEVYTVAYGVVAVGLYEKGQEHIKVYRAKDTVIIPAGIEHNVLPLRNAAFHTRTVGEPVANPEKNGDWWDASPAFAAWCKQFAEKDILAEFQAG